MRGCSPSDLLSQTPTRWITPQSNSTRNVDDIDDALRRFEERLGLHGHRMPTDRAPEGSAPEGNTQDTPHIAIYRRIQALESVLRAKEAALQGLTEQLRVAHATQVGKTPCGAF